MALDSTSQRTTLAFIAGASLALLAVTYTPLAALLSKNDHQDSKGNPSRNAPPSSSRPQTQAPPQPASSLANTIGNTPLTLLPTLSRLTQCSIYAKLELLNPGGSPKDRVARSILHSLQHPSSTNTPPLAPGDTIYEAPSAQLALRESSEEASVWHTKAFEEGVRGEVEIFADIPALLKRQSGEGNDDDAGSTKHDPDAKSDSIIINITGRAHFANQFESPANYRAHYHTTGPEIYTQMDGQIDAFVAGAGTGGTISGVGLYLKEKTHRPPRVVLADPTGSGLYNKVKHNIFFSPTEREGTRRRSQVDTIIEGIGLTRSTFNWQVGDDAGVVDDAVRVTDEEARRMARWLCWREGWFVGGSSAVNCVAALRTALALGPGHRIVTIFCDSGMRHLSKFWAGIDPADSSAIGDVGEASMAELEEILAAETGGD
ncbi:Cysteine synthase 2 [Cyphellophora attinorum]|uniref:Cysteine synthase 2 n=1 Tax=Cyphellophora attinorum TaxID=1664694 RepID=A0A0N1NXV3_9EURO|nr:Cysteine synthase 2 [Phialophora attinorum]KPI35636.1 Cysteine synthase 2 [Phialophora attinorum]